MKRRHSRSRKTGRGVADPSSLRESRRAASECKVFLACVWNSRKHLAMNCMELNEDSLTILRSFHEDLSRVPKDAAGILLDFCENSVKFCKQSVGILHSICEDLASGLLGFCGDSARILAGFYRILGGLCKYSFTLGNRFCRVTKTVDDDTRNSVSISTTLSGIFRTSSLGSKSKFCRVTKSENEVSRNAVFISTKLLRIFRTAFLATNFVESQNQQTWSPEIQCL